MTVEEERGKMLDLAIGNIEKKHGKGTIMRLGDSLSRLQVPIIPTGSVELDIALGIGGIPRGRVTELFGSEGSGKTTLTYHIIAEAQKQGGFAAFIDTEHALDASWARKCGVDVDSLYVAQPDTGEEALDIADELVRSASMDIIVIDSVAGLVPRAELEGDMGDATVGAQARLMSQAMRKLGGSLGNSKTAAIFTNQIREKIGVFFGSPETTPGGRALKFWSSVRMRIGRRESIRVSNEVIGARAGVKIVKNKLAPPFREAEFDIMFDQGISREGSLVDAGTSLGIVEKNGTWFSYDGERLGQGKENARRLLQENKELASQLERRIREEANVPLPSWLASENKGDDTIQEESA